MAVGVSEGLSRESLFRVLLRAFSAKPGPSPLSVAVMIYLYFSHWRD
jgi:hypothetical protein